MIPVLTTSFLLIISTTTILATAPSYKTSEIHLNLDIDDKAIHLNWQFDDTENIYGFIISVTDADDKNIYTSPLLHNTANSMTVHEALESGKARVCVAVMVNETDIITDTCETLQVGDMQMVIGILAGVVFLIPCIAAMIYIIYKDLNVQKRTVYEESEIEILIKPVIDVAASTSGETGATAKNMKGKDNPAFDCEQHQVKYSVAVDHDVKDNVRDEDQSEGRTLSERSSESTGKTAVKSDKDKTVLSKRQQTDASVSDQQTNTDKTEIYVIRL